MSVTFILGGARSGKSNFAEKKAREYGEKVLYIATAIATDESMADRIRRHKEQRPKEWNTIEIYTNFERLLNIDEFIESDVILIDCITIMVSNIMIDSGIDFDNCDLNDLDVLESNITNNIFTLINICNKNKKKLIIVSNETGMGVVPSYYMGNYFRDITGRLNNKIGSAADFMYFILSGMPIKLKHNGELIKWPQDF